MCFHLCSLIRLTPWLSTECQVKVLVPLSCQQVEWEQTWKKNAIHNKQNIYLPLLSFLHVSLKSDWIKSVKTLSVYYLYNVLFLLFLYLDKRTSVSPTVSDSGSRDDSSAGDPMPNGISQMMTLPVAMKTERESPKEAHNSYSSSFLTLSPPKTMAMTDGHYQQSHATHAHMYGNSQTSGLNLGIVAS